MKCFFSPAFPAVQKLIMNSIGRPVALAEAGVAFVSQLDCLVEEAASACSLFFFFNTLRYTRFLFDLRILGGLTAGHGVGVRT